MSGKSKTDVAARTGAKNLAKLCTLCGNKVDVVMAVTPTGKKSMKRLCCEA
ncbi:MAG: hypothetical protein ABFR82_10825 [Nitrospirota bacterium]